MLQKDNRYRRVVFLLLLAGVALYSFLSRPACTIDSPPAWSVAASTEAQCDHFYSCATGDTDEIENKVADVAAHFQPVTGDFIFQEPGIMFVTYSCIYYAELNDRRFRKNLFDSCSLRGPPVDFL